jgi:hypothetical protein
MPPRVPAPLPSVLEYKDALSAINMSDGQRDMLRAHYLAPNHLITSTELADAAGYKGYQGANLQYGRMGKELRYILNYFDTYGQESYVIAQFYEPGTRGNIDWLWEMHPVVVEALRSLGWFDKPS